MMTLTLATVYLLPLSTTAEPGYPNPNLLIEPQEVARNNNRFRILDVRPKMNYETGHIPGAVHVQFSPWSKAVSEGKADAAFWKREFAEVGISPDRPVVVVSDDVRDGARTWWLLSHAGVPDVRLLNGGWDAYVKANLPTSKDAVSVPAVPHDWKPAPYRQATRDDVAEVSRNRRPGHIIDARSAKEFDAGHVPGAVRLEWSELLDPMTKKFKPAAEISMLLKERNINLAEENCSY
jgi:thiosulfate/3-mercaptopyruvate sulfurtransferase